MRRGCRQSPEAHASLAGTAAEQTLEGIDPRRVAIAPLDLEAIRAHEGEGKRPDIGGDGGRIQQWPATHLLHAAGARAGQTQVAGGKEPFVTTLVPLDAEPVVLSIDGVGDLHRRKEGKRERGKEGKRGRGDREHGK